MHDIRCPGCGHEIPSFPSLGPERESLLRGKAKGGEPIQAMRELIAATGCSLLQAKMWIEHPDGPSTHGRNEGPGCFYCGEALRTPMARQCVACGMDWHDVRRVIRLGAPVVVDEDGPPDILHNLPVVAWARIDPGVSSTGRTTHRTQSGPIPTAEGLVITKDLDSGGWYVFHTDTAWTSRADTWHASLEDAQDQAAFEFEGIADRWRYRPPPERA